MPCIPPSLGLGCSQRDEHRSPPPQPCSQEADVCTYFEFIMLQRGIGQAPPPAWAWRTPCLHPSKGSLSVPSSRNPRSNSEQGTGLGPPTYTEIWESLLSLHTRCPVTRALDTEHWAQEEPGWNKFMGAEAGVCPNPLGRQGPSPGPGVGP